MPLSLLLPHEVRSAWRVGYDMPEALQLAAYIGKAEGYTPPDGAAETAAVTLAEADWRAWWDRLLGDNVGLRIERARAAMPGASFAEQVRAAHPSDLYDPPLFDALDAPPTIQALCRRHWSAFHEWWDSPLGREKRRLANALRDANQRLSLNQIVYHSVKAAGKRVSASFALSFDIVIWPADYLHPISDQHIILGADYLTSEHAEAYRALHASFIARIV